MLFYTDAGDVVEMIESDVPTECPDDVIWQRVNPQTDV